MKTYPEIYKQIEHFVLKRLAEIKRRSEIDEPPQGWEWLCKFEKGVGVNIACGNNPMTNSINVDSAATLGSIIGVRSLGDDLYEFEDNSLDFVLCNCPEVFPNPSKLFKEWRRVLKPGGICAVVTINADAWDFNDNPLTPRRHSIFTIKTLNFYFKKAGFKHLYSEIFRGKIRMSVEKV